MIHVESDCFIVFGPPLHSDCDRSSPSLIEVIKASLTDLIFSFLTISLYLYKVSVTAQVKLYNG